MGEIVNLRIARKRHARAAAESVASTNRSAHGRTKAERQAAVGEEHRLSRLLDGAKMDSKD